MAFVNIELYPTFSRSACGLTCLMYPQSMCPKKKAVAAGKYYAVPPPGKIFPLSKAGGNQVQNSSKNDKRDA